MGNLGKLIKGQTIRIDAHKQGCGEQNDFNDQRQDVHIHKYFKEGDKKYGKTGIRIPLNHDNPVSISDKVPRKIKNEIEDVLNSQENREEFLDSVYNNLRENWKWDDNEANRNDIAGRIAGAFEMKLLLFSHQPISTRRVYILIPNSIEGSADMQVSYFVAVKDKGFEIGQLFDTDLSNIDVWIE